MDKYSKQFIKIKKKNDRKIQFWEYDRCEEIVPNHTKEDILNWYKKNPNGDYKQLIDKFDVGCLRFRDELKEEGLI